jgi:teichuronic acid exporter
LDLREAIADPEKTAAKGPLSSNLVAPAGEMDQSFARSLVWRATGDWSSQILSWASFVIVVRLLTPADFGIVAMAVILLPYLRYVSEFGIPRTIITFRDLTEDQLGQLNTISVVFGLVCFVLAALLAKPVAVFFRTPGLTAIVVVTCIALLPLSARAVSEGLLAKEMQFGLLAWYDAVNSFVSAVLTLVLAFFGLGYWALVLGNLLATFVRSSLILRARPHRFAKPRLQSIRKQILFGWHTSVSVVALNSYQRLDNLTAGRFLGQAALGFYGMAWNLANMPMEKVTSIVTTVAPTYLAAVQNQPAELRRYVRTLTEVIALATFPATVGLGLVSRELVPLAFGHKWDGVIVPLEVLSIYAAFRSIVALLSKVLTAVGNARYVMWNDLAALVILPTAFYIGSHWGTSGIAWGWVAAYPLVAVPLYRKMFKTLDLHVSEYFRSIRPAIEGTLMLSLGVGLVKYATPSGRGLLVRLVLEIGAGVVVYVSVLLLLHRERMLSVVRMARSFHRSQAPA